MLKEAARLPTNAAEHEAAMDVGPAPGPNLARLLIVLVPATSIMYALFNGLQQILIPARLEALDPSSKVANLALLTSASAIASMLATPIGGAISDRTESPFGRRTPWLILMSLLSAAMIVAMGYVAREPKGARAFSEHL